MPRTGGGGMVRMKASWMAASLPFSSRLDMGGASSPAASRSSNGSKAEKMAPAFDALVKVAPSKPGEGHGVRDAFGVQDDLASPRATTASVRDSEAPGGSWITVIR